MAIFTRLEGGWTGVSCASYVTHVPGTERDQVSARMNRAIKQRVRKRRKILPQIER